MNPLVAATLADKIDFNELIKLFFKRNKQMIIAATVLIVLAVLVIMIKKKIKSSSTAAKQNNYLDRLDGDIQANKLSYSLSWYEGKAVTLARALDASFGNNGGILGCDQETVYEIMSEMKTVDDIVQLEKSFGTRELNASWLKKKKPMLLREAIQDLMITSERKKVNNILKDNGIDYSF